MPPTNTYRNKPAISPTLQGYVPPQATDLEAAVLGAVMLEKEAFEVVAGILKPDSFYLDAHQKIYQSFLQLHQDGYPIDLLTVTEQLRKTGVLETVGGAFFVTKLTNDVTTGAHIQAHARIVHEKYMLREAIRQSHLIIQRAYEQDDCFEVVEGAITALSTTLSQATKVSYVSIKDVATEVVLELEHLQQHPEQSPGLPTGYNSIDKLTGGFMPGHLIVIAARPSVGKTAFAISINENMAVQDIPNGIVTLEMKDSELVKRVFSRQSKVGNTAITKGRLSPAEHQQVMASYKKIAAFPLWLCDVRGIDIHELKSIIRKMVREKGIKIVFIDYLQLIRHSLFGKEVESLSIITSELKILAQELDIPIVLLSQLNRDSTKAGSKTVPTLDQLRGSGSIEQDADMVIILYRVDDDGNVVDNKHHSNNLIVSLQKFRNGKPTDLTFKIDYNTQMFYDDVPDNHPISFTQAKVPKVEKPGAGIFRNYYEKDNDNTGDMPF